MLLQFAACIAVYLGGRTAWSCDLYSFESTIVARFYDKLYFLAFAQTSKAFCFYSGLQQRRLLRLFKIGLTRCNFERCRGCKCSGGCFESEDLACSLRQNSVQAVFGTLRECWLCTWCTNRSSPPPAGVIKPNPFDALNLKHGQGYTRTDHNPATTGYQQLRPESTLFDVGVLGESATHHLTVPRLRCPSCSPSAISRLTKTYQYLLPANTAAGHTVQSTKPSTALRP